MSVRLPQMPGRSAPRQNTSRRTSTFVYLSALAGLVWLGGAALTPHRAAAQSQGSAFEIESEPVRHLTMVINKSRTIRLQQSFRTAVVAAPDIADARPMSDHVIYVQAKKIGTTNLVAFDSDMKVIGVLDIEVTPDTGALQARMRSSGASGIHVSSSNGQFILSGVAPSAVAAEQAVSIARSFATAGGGQGNDAVNVVNAITVAQPQQVMLKVRFLEVTRQAGRDLGVRWFAGNHNGYGVNTGQGTTTSPIGVTGPGGTTWAGASTPGGVPIISTTGSLIGGGSPFVTLLGRAFSSGSGNVDVMLNALEQKGLLRRLAEPDLVALSGDTAAFLAGGEFPYPSVQSASPGSPAQTTIQFQPFGVQLTFSPTVLGNGVINLRLAPSVSELDFSNTVAIAGTVVPSLITRKASTTIELRDGQSFAIAGLLQSHDRQNVAQLPWIGNVPVLGTLFSSKDFQKDETDLVVIVTPHLVQPAAPNQKIATPLDKTVPSNDVDFFLLGQMERRKDYQNYVTAGGGLQGPYGYILPPDPGAAVASSAPAREQPVIHNK